MVNFKLSIEEYQNLSVTLFATQPFRHYGHIKMIMANHLFSDYLDVRYLTKQTVAYHTGNSDKCGCHLSANVDDWTWKIQNLF